MYCPKCGRELPENEVCNCGAGGVPQQPAPPVDPTYSYPPQSPPEAYMPPQPLSYADPPAVAALRGLGSSPLMLALCILFSAYFISGIPAMFLQPQTAINFYLDVYNTRQATVDLPVSMASLTTVIGLWMFYAACRKTQGLVSTAGITVIKVFFLVGAIASLIFLSIGSLGLMLVPAVLSQFSDILSLRVPPETLAIIVVVLGIIAIFMLAYVILSMIFTLKTLGGIRDVARSGMPNNKTSMVLIVFLFIQALGLAASAPFAGAAFFSPLIGAAATVMLALVLLHHRKNMKTVIMQNAVGSYIPPNPPQGY